MTLDNVSNAGDQGCLDELYIVNLGGGLGGGRVSIRDTGLGLGNDELIVNGTPGPDQVTLDAVGTGSTRTGAITFGDVNDPSRNIVSYRGIALVSINTLGGNDTVLSNDTASVTLISLGEGDDAIVVGTVPLMPDPGNRTLEFPDGVPVVDIDNLTNGNSDLLFVLGERRQRQLRGQPQPRAALPARRRGRRPLPAQDVPRPQARTPTTRTRSRTSPRSSAARARTATSTCRTARSRSTAAPASTRSSSSARRSATSSSSRAP